MSDAVPGRSPGRRPIVTLLTDFGLSDAYVGAMKGVIASLAPDAAVIDICHQIPAQDTLKAGLVWAAAVKWFPRGTIHVAVVDPGVGTRRKILAVQARSAVFLAPDNGMLGYVLERREVRRLRRVSRRELFLPEVGSTFHGRDIFAPVAARLAAGLPLEAVGPLSRTSRWARLPRPRRRRVRRGGREIVEERGEILVLDAFGNATTNIRPRAGFDLVSLRAADVVIRGISPAYGSRKPGRTLALVGSAGYVEVAVNQGSAERSLGLRRATPVVAEWRRTD